ncbi:MAG: RNA polymerase sigma factor [Actinomycetota bacterium]
MNLVRSGHRSKKLRSLKPVPDWAGDRRVGPADERLGDRLQVIDALEHLSPIRRATVLLRFYEDMSEQEIARVLDRPLGTVKSDIHRALRQLRPLLEDANSEELRR